MARASRETGDEQPGNLAKARGFVSHRRSPITVLGLGTGIAALALLEWWPFDGAEDATATAPSIWRLLLSERLTLGFVRLALAGACFYVLASIGVRMVHDEWLRKAGGAETGKARKWEDAIQQFKDAADRAVEEREDYRRRLSEYEDMVEIETAP